MAIQKTKTLTNGMTGNYWKITNAIIDKQKMNITARIALFTSSAYTATTPLPGAFKLYLISVTKEQLVGDLMALCYTSIKTQAATTVNGSPKDPDIAGGTDV